MCLELKHCMFVRWVVFMTGQYHLYELRKIDARKNPDGFRPIYNDGSMEARELPDAIGYIGDNLNEAHRIIGDKLRDTDCSTDIVLAANAAAWGFVTPELVKKGNGGWLRQTLLGLDETARMIEIEEEHILNPVTYLSLFDLGALDSTFGRVAKRLEASETSKWESSVPLETVSKQLIASVKYSGTNVVNGQSQRRTTTTVQQRSSGGALEGSDNGRLDSAATPANEGTGTNTSEHYVVRQWPPVEPAVPAARSSGAAASSSGDATIGNGAGLDFNTTIGVGGACLTSFSRPGPSHRGFGSMRW